MSNVHLDTFLAVNEKDFGLIQWLVLLRVHRSDLDLFYLRLLFVEFFKFRMYDNMIKDTGRTFDVSQMYSFILLCIQSMF